MKKLLAALALVAVLADPTWAQSFTITVTGTWTLPADGDNNAVFQLQQILVDNFAPASVVFLLVSAVQSPVQTIPGATTFDTSVVFEVVSPALTLSDSLTKVNLKSVGKAILKAAKLSGTRED